MAKGCRLKCPLGFWPWCPKRRGQRHPGDASGGRDGNNASTSQGTPRTACDHQKLRDRHKTDSSGPPEGNQLPASTLILDFRLPEPENAFPLF